MEEEKIEEAKIQRKVGRRGVGFLGRQVLEKNWPKGKLHEE